MSFYDANGKLIDFNDSMRELCVFNDQMEAYFRKTCMFDAPALQNDFDRTSKHSFHVCQRMYYPEIGIDKYLDFRIRPTFDDQDHLLYYIVTSRDVTAEREMDMEQRKHEKKLRHISKRVSRYEHELNYLLKNGNMFVWSISFKTMEIIFSRSLSSYEFRESFEDYLNSMFQDERAAAASNLKALMESRQPFNNTHHFLSTPIDNGPQWYAISGMPIIEDDGECTGYFGVLKNVNDLMTVQEQLKKERTRAEASGTMKSAFLANMTHEIRTPLNAIVGFSDLLQIIDEPADRQEFIRIIRNNCDMLLRLINDILEASGTGQTLAIATTDVDFSQVFDDICQTLAQRVQEPGVEFLKENPYPTLNTTLDKGRVQQVITNFVTNAVKYTREGHIKVGYRKQDEGLYIYCEDTGAGIPKDKQASVFERFVKLNDFVQGTGLGLSICKTIAERCNGKIGVFSEGEGKGSTFWLWIPCELNKD
jgi:signal transduction histidine kinase